MLYIYIYIYNVSAFILFTAGDTAGVVGTGVQFAADYVPDEIGQSMCVYKGIDEWMNGELDRWVDEWTAE